MTEDAKGKEPTAEDTAADKQREQRDALSDLYMDFFMGLLRMAPKDTSHAIRQDAFTLITSAAGALVYQDPDQLSKISNAAQLILAPLHETELEKRYATYVEILHALARTFTPKEHRKRRAFRVPVSESKHLIAFEASTVINDNALKHAIEQLRKKCDPAFDFLDYWNDPRVNDALEALAIETRGGPNKPGFYRAAAEIAISVGAFNTFDLDISNPTKRRNEIKKLQSRIKKACTKRKNAAAKIEVTPPPAVTPIVRTKKGARVI